MADYPSWFQQLRTYYASNSARMFVLHFNVDDYVIAPDEAGPITRLVPFLERYARQPGANGSRFGAVFRYSHSLDVVPDDQLDTTTERLVLGAVGGAALGSAIGGVRGALTGAAAGAASARMSETFGHDIYRNEERQIGELPDPTDVLRVFERILRSAAQRSLVIIEHAETLVPRDMPGPDELLNREILTRLATDYVFRSTDNLCLLITRDINLIESGIYAPGANCFPIQIDLPNEAERVAFLEAMEAENEQEELFSTGGRRTMRRTLISGLAQIDPKLREMIERSQGASDRAEEIRVFGKAAQGFRLVEIDQLNRQVRAEHEFSRGTADGSTDSVADDAIIRLDDIKRHKRRAIREQSNGLLEVIDVQRGFDAIGGMEIVKSYLRTLSERIVDSASDPHYLHLIPRGLILAGPPGTGKTIIAEALALESNLNMVKLRNVREGLVGQSERNLTRALDVIRALAPILVFVDEIDQAFGARSLGQSSDGGTSERIFGQILEFLGDDRNRGHVIWVAATNRVDVLDAAMLRRFDRIIPCLLPTPEEQMLILAAMPHSISTLRYDEDLAERIAQGNHHVAELLAGKHGLVPTGAVIETIARRAAECAGDRARAGRGAAEVGWDDLRLAVEDYRSNTNVTMYDYQGLLAIQACNFYSVMPLLPDRAPFDSLVEPRDTPLATDSEGVAVPAFWRENAISYTRLDDQIRDHRAQLGMARREEGVFP